MKGPLCAHQCCPIGVGAHSGAHFCTDTHGGGALGDALGDRVMTLALWRAISQQEQPDLVLFCSWQRSWQGAGGFERCRCHGCWGFSHARTALSRERAPPAKRTRPACSSTPPACMSSSSPCASNPGLLPSTQKTTFPTSPFEATSVFLRPSTLCGGRASYHASTRWAVPRGLRERRDERRARQLEGHARPTQSTVGDLKKLSRPTPCTPGKNT